MRPTTTVYLPVDLCGGVPGRLTVNTAGQVTVSATAFGDARTDLRHQRKVGAHGDGGQEDDRADRQAHTDLESEVSARRAEEAEVDAFKETA